MVREVLDMKKVDDQWVWEDASTPDEPQEVESSQSVDEFLDQSDLDRMEYERLTTDLYPGGDASDPDISTPATHKDTDEIQKFMASQRQA